MRSICATCTLLLLLCVMMSAQEFPRAEVFGGYSYLRADTNISKTYGVNGWESAVTVNGNKWFAGEFAVSGYYYNFSIFSIPVSIRDYAFAAGPRVNIKKFYVRAIFGTDRLSGSVEGLSASQNSFAGKLGIGIEQPISRRFAIRGGADYAFTRHNVFGGSRVTQNNGTASIGLVYRFGFVGSHARSQTRSPSNSTEKALMAIPSLGIRVAVYERGGAEIGEVAHGSVAEFAGLRVGDVINAVNESTVKTPMELAAALSDIAPGTKVRLGYMVRGQWQSETLVLLGK